MEDLYGIHIPDSIKIDAPPEPEYRYFRDVPQTLRENVEYRKKLRKQCAADRGLREEINRRCARDSLYWASVFCFLFEPRPEPKIIPYIPWPHQLPVWKTTEQFLGYGDMGWEKSRGEGASWMACLIALHRWIYVPMFAVGIVSKDEASVDNPDNPDSLFWKIAWEIERLPAWMRPKFTRSRKSHSFVNQINGASITGFAATPNVGTGGRKTLFIMDEAAKFPRGGRPPADQACMDSTQHVTDSRLLISTPFGPSGVFFKSMTQSSSIVKMQLHWTQNPVRIIGAYKVHIGVDGRRRVELVDLDYWLEKVNQTDNRYYKQDLPLLARDIRNDESDNAFGYPFMLEGDYVKDGALRSVWYDRQCRRPGTTPKSIAQELDLDYGGSASRFFDIVVLDRHIKTDCENPRISGALRVPKAPDSHHELSRPKFANVPSGHLHLWIELDLSHHPPANRNYVVGCDIGAGTGGVESSNSSATVLDRDSGVQVAEFTLPDMIPTDFADACVALCYFFSGLKGPALLIWEANGPGGQQFTKRLTDLGYSRIYNRSANLEEYSERKTKYLGFWSNGRTKPVLLGEFGRALDAGELKVRSKQTLYEAKFYMNFPGGKVEHVAAMSEEDPSGAAEAHGDRVIGAALAWWVAKDYKASIERADREPPPNSFAARQKAARRAERQKAAPGWIPRSQRRRGTGDRYTPRGLFR